MPPVRRGATVCGREGMRVTDAGMVEELKGNFTMGETRTGVTTVLRGYGQQTRVDMSGQQRQVGLRLWLGLG